MLCPHCGTNNRVGQSYCSGCGVRLELTESQARAQALAEVRFDNWHKAVLAFNRLLFMFFIVFLGVLVFNGYARRDIIGEFSPGAPLPPPPPVVVSPGLIEQPELALPALPVAVPMKPDKADEAEILNDLGQTARDRLVCNVALKTGIVKGTFLGKTSEGDVLVIVGWGPPLQVRVIPEKDIDAAHSQFPQ